MANGSITLYEHRHFSTEGRVKELDLAKYSENSLHNLHAIDFKDCLSSLKWNLSIGVTAVFYEHNDGTGRQYEISGSGEDDDIYNNSFKDCASSWRWYK